MEKRAMFFEPDFSSKTRINPESATSILLQTPKALKRCESSMPIRANRKHQEKNYTLQGRYATLEENYHNLMKETQLKNQIFKHQTKQLEKLHLKHERNRKQIERLRKALGFIEEKDERGSDLKKMQGMADIGSRGSDEDHDRNEELFGRKKRRRQKYCDQGENNEGQLSMPYQRCVTADKYSYNKSSKASSKLGMSQMNISMPCTPKTVSNTFIPLNSNTNIKSQLSLQSQKKMLATTSSSTLKGAASSVNGFYMSENLKGCKASGVLKKSKMAERQKIMFKKQRDSNIKRMGILELQRNSAKWEEKKDKGHRSPSSGYKDRYKFIPSFPLN